MQFVTRNIKPLFYIYTVILVLIAVLPINSSGSSINHTFIVSIRMDYLLHFSIFLPWMFLMRLHSGLSFHKSTWRPLSWIFLGLLFAICTEIVQYFLPYRAFNINDLLANGLGVVLGFLFFMKKNGHPEPVEPACHP
jgi:VanZ family protein